MKGRLKPVLEVKRSLLGLSRFASWDLEISSAPILSYASEWFGSHTEAADSLEKAPLGRLKWILGTSSRFYIVRGSELKVESVSGLCGPGSYQMA